MWGRKSYQGWRILQAGYEACRIRAAESAYARRKKRVVREDKKRLAIWAAEEELQWALGDVDLRGLLAIRRVDEDLAVGDIDISVPVAGDAFTAAPGEQFYIG